MYDRFETFDFWDNRATALLNQNVNYPNIINDYFIKRKTFVLDILIREFKPKKVLDAGSGVGSVFIPLAKKYDRINFIALDFSQNNLNEIDKLQLKNVVTIKSDISHIPLSKKSIDVLFSFDVLCHLKFNKLPLAIKEFKRVAKIQYYNFHALEYSMLPYYYFMFSRLKLPKKLVVKLSLKYAQKVEKNILPSIRGLL